MEFLDNKTVGALTIFGLLVVASLAVFEFDVADSSTSRTTSPVFEKIADLERIELMYPADENRPELVVFERRDDQWWLIRPVEQKVDQQWSRRLENDFGGSIGTDDLVFDAERAEEFLLDDDNAVRVALFGVGDQRPVRELLVGKPFEVAETGARRTFVKSPRGASIYRARAGFGQLVRQPVERFRDRRLLDIDARNITGFYWPKKEVRRVRSAGRWRDPSTGESTPDDRMDRFTEFVAGLRVERWLGGVAVEEAGFEDPTSVVVVEIDGRKTRLEIGAPVGESDETGYFYGRYSETDGFFLLSARTVDWLRDIVDEPTP